MVTPAEDREFRKLVGEPTPARTSWAPIPLAAILSGEHPDQAPTMLARTDGRCLIYRERAHALHAEPEALKTWLALGACAEQLQAGETVLFVDCEDTALSIIQRLRALGVRSETILDRFIYLRPDEPLSDAAIQDLEHSLQAKPTLAVIDGVTEAFSQQRLNPLDNSDVATWLDLLPRRLIRGGAAVLLLDHVVKDREQRGRYAIGAQHKLAGVDVAYSMRVLEPFARGREGLVAIKVEKDRPGRVRQYAPDGQVALLRASSKLNGSVTIALEPPSGQDVTFRPTVLMERISMAIENDPGLTKRAIRTSVGGKNSAKDLALELLISESYVDVRKEGQAARHYSVERYREADDSNCAPVPPACPNRAPARPAQPCPRAPAPTGGHGHGTGANGTPNSTDRAPETVAANAHTNGDFPTKAASDPAPFDVDSVRSGDHIALRRALGGSNS